jgi:hypothetical protein
MNSNQKGNKKPYVRDIGVLLFMLALFVFGLLLTDVREHLLGGSSTAWISFILLILSQVVIFILVRYGQNIVKGLTNLQILAANKKVLWLVILIVIQFTLASISYWAYYKNPKLFVLADEIENRHLEILKMERDIEANNIKTVNGKVQTRLELFKYIKENEGSFIKSKDGKLFLNDSLYVIVENPLHIPGGQDEMTMLFYSKSNLESIGFLYCMSGPFEIAIQNEINRMERESTLIQNRLKDVNSKLSDQRWGYLYFLSYYFREQLQPMSSILIIIQFLKYLVWFLLTTFIASPFWKTEKSETIS